MRITNVIFAGDSPVPAQEARALAIHDALDEYLVEHVTEQWATLKRGMIAAAAAFLVGVVLIATGAVGIGIGAVFLGLVVGGGTYYVVTTREPNVSVEGLEKGYWTGHLVPHQGETVVFDATGTVDQTEFQVELLPGSERIETIKGQLDDLEEFPVLLDGEQGVESAFLETLGDLETAIEDAERHEIRAPLVPADHQATDSLAQLLEQADGNSVDAGGVSMSLSAAEERIESLSEFEAMIDEDRGESVLLEVSEQSRRLANELSTMQETAIERLNDHINTAGDQFGKITYHFYCPDCLSDDIDTRLEQRDRDWFCPTCRSTYPQGIGVPRHRIRDDLVLEISDHLWIEKDDQLRDIYENIEDQKTELEEREFEQRREEIRNVGDRIRDIRQRIRDLRTEAKAKRGTVDRIGDLMVKYDRLNEQKKERFQRDVRETFEEIDQQTERAVEEMRGVVEGRIEQAEQEAKEKAELMREEERAMRREEIAYQEAMNEQRHREQMEHHREERLLETEGEIHAFDTVNAIRDKKGAILGRSKYEG